MRECAILHGERELNKDVREKHFQYEVIYLALTQLSSEMVVPPTGFEPVHLPPEGSALSPELRGPADMRPRG